MTEASNHNDLPRPAEGWLQRNMSAIIVLSSLPVLGYITLRNEPIEDAMFSQVIRFFLSVAAAMVAKDLPGYLDLNLGAGEQQIKAVGAVGVLVLTYLGTPYISPALNPDAKRDPPALFDTYGQTVRSFVTDLDQGRAAGGRQGQPLYWLREYVHAYLRAEECQEVPVSPADDSQLPPVSEAEASELPPVAEPNDPQLPPLSDPINAQPQPSNRRERFHSQLVVVESENFDQPYKSFLAVVVAPPAPSQAASDSHSIFGFLVPGNRQDQAFIPLRGLYDLRFDRHIFHVPESNAGDYLFFIMHLKLATNLARSEQVNVTIRTLK